MKTIKIHVLDGKIVGAAHWLDVTLVGNESLISFNVDDDSKEVIEDHRGWLSLYRGI